MRITGGALRGRVLQSPPDLAIRPTADKTRLAIFNIIESRGGVVDRVVLDLCCGTGALGLDALSRGAALAVLVDEARTSLDLARTNARLLKQENKCHFLQANGVDMPPRGTFRQSDLVFLDPPYHRNLVPQMIESLRQQGWLAKGAVLVVETELAATGFDSSDLTALTEKTYGQTRVTLLRYDPVK